MTDKTTEELIQEIHRMLQSLLDIAEDNRGKRKTQDIFKEEQAKEDLYNLNRMQQSRTRLEKDKDKGIL